jgi:hypothetical protein
MIFCEIDCREGILLAVSRGKYEVWVVTAGVVSAPVFP